MPDGSAASLAGLDPSPDELADLADVLAEMDIYPVELYSGDEDQDDAAGLAYEYGDGADLESIGAVVDLANLTEQQRLAEDELELPARAEDRTAWLLDRVARHTYTPPDYYRDPTDLAGGDPGYGCGIYDTETGRCSARYHQATCIETTRQSAATSDHEAVSQFRDVLMAGTRTAVELANRTGPGFDDLREDPGPADVETLAEMRRILGIGGRAGAPQPMRAAVTITPAELGGW
jgi:hypothetical protein